MKEHVLVVCPGCKLKFKVPVHLIGKRARCNDCQTIFVLDAPAEMLEDTVAEWLFDSATPPKSADAAVAPRRQSAGLPVQTPAGAAAAAKPASGIVPIVGLEPVRLERIDEMGAYFEFPAERLPDYQLRGSMPRKCLGCGSNRNLRVHLLVWTDRLPARDQLRVQDAQAQVSGMLAQYEGQSLEEFLGRLPQVKALPMPYSLPFPYFACPDCSTIGEILTHVLAHGQREYCQVMIANLEVAAEFLANNGGADSEDYHMVLEAWQHQKEDPWRTLALGVRNRLSNWFEKRPGERFVDYFPDAEFSKAELGNAGVILTNRRAIYRKYTAKREFEMTKVTNLRCTSGPAKWMMEISQTGVRPATLSLSPHQGGRFLKKCRGLWSGLHVAEQAADPADVKP
jgi:hypothetical protein